MVLPPLPSPEIPTIPPGKTKLWIFPSSPNSTHMMHGFRPLVASVPLPEQFSLPLLGTMPHIYGTYRETKNSFSNKDPCVLR